MFVAMDKITDHGAVKAAKVTELSSITKQKPFDIKINSRVSFWDKYSVIYIGVTKWIGKSKSSGEAVVGIEVVSYNYKRLLIAS